MDYVEFRTILRVVWKRLWLIVLVTVLIGALFYVLNKDRAPVYQAKATLMVDQSAANPLGNYGILSTAEDLASTYSRLLVARPLLEIVIANLGLDISPGHLKGQMLGTQLIPGTQLLELTVKDTDPQRAAAIANELAYTFISTHNSEQQLESIVVLEEEVVSQMNTLRLLLEQNQSALEKLPVTSDPLLEAESNRLQSTLASQQTTYASLLGTYLSLRLTQAEMLDVSVVEPAVVTTARIGRSVRFYVLLGVFVGFFFGAGLVFLLEYLDHTFATEDDVKQVLSLPALGTIPRRRWVERKSRLVAAELPHSPVSEAYRTLRTNIRFTSVDQPLQTLLVTSAEPRAGKTSVTANLGVVCAQAGLRVVLIDGDLRYPQLHLPFELANQVGLTNLLIGDVPEVAGSLQETGIDGLRLVASGPIPPNPSELLGSKRMETVLGQVSEDADLVILDSPPALLVSDASVLGARADGALLVVEAKRTSHEVARKAREALEAVNANILGVALTKVKTSRRRYRYYAYEAKTQPVRRFKWKRWSRLVNFRL